LKYAYFVTVTDDALCMCDKQTQDVTTDWSDIMGGSNTADTTMSGRRSQNKDN